MSLRNIIIIHESSSEREALKKMIELGSEKFSVVEADSEMEAELLIKNLHFNIVISNKVMNLFRRLPESETHVIVLIPEDTKEYLDQLKEYNIQHYHVISQKPEVLLDKINMIIRKGYSRNHKCYDVKGGTILFHTEKEDRSGSVLNISLGGFLCELVIDEDDDLFQKNSIASITIPKKIRKSEVKNIECTYLATRKSEPEDGKIRVWVVFQFAGLSEEQLGSLKSAFKSFESIKEPIVQWKDRQLHLNINGATTVFYPVHLFRISMISLVVIICFVTGIMIFSEDKMKVIWTDGQLMVRSSDADPWEVSKDKEFSVDTSFFIAPPDKFKKGEYKEDAEKSPVFFGVLRYAPNETIILSRKGTITRDAESSDTISYRLTGAVHILLGLSGEKKEYHLDINGMKFVTDGAHVFFSDDRPLHELTVIKGSLRLFPQQDFFFSIPEMIEPENGALVIDQNELITIKKGKVLVQHIESVITPHFNETFLPGFTTDSIYRHIGYLTKESGELTLVRNELKYNVTAGRIPVMEKDTIISDQAVRVLINFYNDDVIRLYQGTQFSINEFSLPEKYPLVPLIIGLNAQEVGKPLVSRFKFKGRVRAKINPKIKRRRFKLRSSHAVIGVKGTEFEAVSDQTGAQVMTLAGRVTLSDKEEKTSVEITRGMMSSIVEGKKPTEPEPIPKDKLLELMSDSIEKEDGFAFSPYNTIDPKKIVLDLDESVSLIWNRELKSAYVKLAGKHYPISVPGNTIELLIKYDDFKGVKEGTYPVSIVVVDHKKQSDTLEAALTILPRVKITNEKIVFNEKIKFERGKATIKAASLPLLNAIVNIIKTASQIKRISIEGHTDNDGAAGYNQMLSDKRARSVRKYLIEQGISADILESKGYGESRPVANNDSEEGKEENRRVEFLIDQHSPSGDSKSN